MDGKWRHFLTSGWIVRQVRSEELSLAPKWEPHVGNVRAAVGLKVPVPLPPPPPPIPHDRRRAGRGAHTDLGAMLEGSANV